MKLRNRLTLAACAFALLVAPAAMAQRPHSTAADNPTWGQAAKDKILERMSQIILNSAYVPGVDFSKWSDTLAKIKPEADKATNPDEFAGAVNAGLRDFNISHIVLMAPRAVAARTEQKTVGIGIRINPVPDGVLVTSTVPGAPAEKAGIEPGDIIMEADGHKVDGPTYIAGPEGTKVVLKVRKADGKSVKDYTVTRASFSTKQPETLTWVDKDTAVLRVYTFDLSYDRENVEKLMGQAMKSKNLLLDLRGNGGGAVVNMMHLLSFLLPKDTPIGTFVNRRLVDSYVEEKKGSPSDLKAIAEFAPNKLKTGSNKLGSHYKGSLAVLVNAGSGSASEITAEALKEHLNAPVIGKKSAGAVLVSIMGDLPHGFNLQFPISDYVSLKGVRLEANGIVPDLEVSDKTFVKKGETDPAYTAAVGLLTRASRAGS